MKVHWKAYSEIREPDGSVTVTSEGAACRGWHGQHPDQKLKLGTKDEVTCKTCIKMREVLRAREMKLQ